MSRHPTEFARYLPVEPAARDWGLYVVDGGFLETPPGTPYPPGQHPEAYMFTWEKGRTLKEYQLGYLTRGRGVFESRSAGRLRVAAGDVFLTFPGEWHRYRPLQTTGWDESWIGFDGEYARRLMGRFFSVEKPVLHVGYSEELLECIHVICDLMETPTVGRRPLMAAKAIEALARVRALAMGSDPGDRRLAESLERARLHLLPHSDEGVDLMRLARQLGLSYSRFRRAFRVHTGLSPRQYHLQIRINRAKALLRDTDRPVAAIAEQIGFSSVHYFSRLFSQRTGRAPLRYRCGATPRER